MLILPLTPDLSYYIAPTAADRNGEQVLRTAANHPTRVPTCVLWCIVRGSASRPLLRAVRPGRRKGAWKIARTAPLTTSLLNLEMCL